MTIATHPCRLTDEPIGPCGVPERLFTAQHESGHCVAARVLANFSSGGAWIEAGPNYVGGLTVLIDHFSNALLNMNVLGLNNCRYAHKATQRDIR